MQDPDLTLYVEINDINFTFFVGGIDKQNKFEILDKLNFPLVGFEDKRVTDLEKVYSTIKENIYLIEQKFNRTFKDVVIILDNFDISFLNLTGSKKLNGSQIVKENIIYILNTMKLCVKEIEMDKTILHIFNSNYNLDNKKIVNLPIGLFGNFYSHELSFVLINSNDYKNLKNIFDKCNIRIKKILLKSFLNGANIINNNKDIGTFFHVEIKKNISKIFYFENNSIKSEQNFNFGLDIVIKDISKVTSLSTNFIEKILNEVEFKENMSEDNFLDKKFFGNENFIKIKKKLIYDIIEARIKEISELMIFKNINYLHYNKSVKKIFLNINDEILPINLKDIYINIFSQSGKFEVFLIDDSYKDSFLNSANRLVHFGWKKEAIPTTGVPKSLIARFFKAIFE